MLVIGDKEVENQSLGLRKRKEGNIGEWSIQETIDRLNKEINSNR
jgi:threonyl-tRNA synthetase